MAAPFWSSYWLFFTLQMNAARKNAATAKLANTNINNTLISQ